MAPVVALAQRSAVSARPAVSTRAAPSSSAAVAAASSSSPAQSIRIKLKSFDTRAIVEAGEAIIGAAASTGATVSGPVPLPTRRRIYTLLRSPHVNKDAREQFETRTHSRLIDIKSPSADTVDKLMLLDLPAGVDVEVKL